jgi:ABC-type nitrate/sulfonate/bicarbonate transport system substrate-binding protein
MTKILCALVLLVISWATPFSLSAAPDVVIGYANISARVSPLWIAQEKGFFAKLASTCSRYICPAHP